MDEGRYHDHRENEGYGDSEQEGDTDRSHRLNRDQHRPCQDAESDDGGQSGEEDGVACCHRGTDRGCEAEGGIPRVDFGGCRTISVLAPGFLETFLYQFEAILLDAIGQM